MWCVNSNGGKYDSRAACMAITTNLVFCIATIHNHSPHICTVLYSGLMHTISKIQLVAYCMGNFLMCYKAMACNIGRQCKYCILM